MLHGTPEVPARRGLADDHHAFHEDAKPGDLRAQLPTRSSNSSKKVGYHDQLELVSFRPQRLYSTLEAEETLSVEVDHQIGQLVEDLREHAGTPPPDPSFAPFRGASQAHG